MINERFSVHCLLNYMSYAHVYKCYVIETDSDLQSLTAYCWAKKRPTIDISMRLTEAS